MSLIFNLLHSAYERVAKGDLGPRGRTRDIELDATVVNESPGAAEVIAALSE